MFTKLKGKRCECEKWVIRSQEPLACERTARGKNGNSQIKTHISPASEKIYVQNTEIKHMCGCIENRKAKQISWEVG